MIRDPHLINVVSACTALVASVADPLIIETALQGLKSQQSDELETERNILAIAALAQAILKAEWQRVKTAT